MLKKAIFLSAIAFAGMNSTSALAASTMPGTSCQEASDGRTWDRPIDRNTSIYSYDTSGVFIVCPLPLTVLSDGADLNPILTYKRISGMYEYEGSCTFSIMDSNGAYVATSYRSFSQGVGSIIQTMAFSRLHIPPTGTAHIWCYLPGNTEVFNIRW